MQIICGNIMVNIIQVIKKNYIFVSSFNETIAKLILQKYSRPEKIFSRSYRVDNED